MLCTVCHKARNEEYESAVNFLVEHGPHNRTWAIKNIRIFKKAAEEYSLITASELARISDLAEKIGYKPRK